MARTAATALAWLGPRTPAAARSRAVALRPLASAAIRIPDQLRGRLSVLFPQGSPQLFVHEGARQALERRLGAAYPGQVVLSITDNRHSIISYGRKAGVLRVRLHHMFLDAPPKILEALVRYVVHAEREASLKVGLYIEENGFRLARRRPRSIKLHTRGKYHDLASVYDDVNQRYFNGNVNALVTWGRASKRDVGATPRKTIKLGSYSALERLIRIHPVLDRAWVPRYVVAFVVYHEMLHHVMPATRANGRRALHPPEFLERERLFRNFERATAWEKRQIARLLRSR